MPDSTTPDRIEKVVELAAPIERVWRAIADPTEFGAWFGVRLDGEFRVGEVKRGPITYPGFEHVTWEARIVAIEPPHLLAFTWNPYAIDPAQDYSGESPTRVEFRLEPSGEGTRLTIRETGFNGVPEHRRAEAFRMNERGWNEQLDNISRHVVSGA